MVGRKAIVKLMAGLVAAASLLAGCSAGGAGGGDQRLSLYTSFGADLYNPMVEAFEKASGIKVDVVFAGTGEMMKRIESEGANPQGDVMLGGGAESFEAYRAIFEPYKVKDDAAVPAALKAPDHLWYGYNSLPMVIMYNKRLVTDAEAPKGWQDLTDPKWANRIAMANATKSGTAFVQVATMLTLFGKEDGKGWETVKGVVKNAKVLDSSSLPPRGVNDGEYAIALTHEREPWKYAQAGGPVGFVYPSEGTATIPDSAAIIKGAKHPQAARQFMDWLFTKEGQELASSLGLRPARTDVAAPEGFLPASEIKMVELDMAWVAANRSALLDTWKDLITSK